MRCIFTVRHKDMSKAVPTIVHTADGSHPDVLKSLANKARLEGGLVVDDSGVSDMFVPYHSIAAIKLKVIL